MARVSAIIPTFNRRATLPRAINSVLKQSMSDLEIIVVDDGSRDDTESWIRTVKDPGVRYYKLAENRGPARARNVGISCCRGQLVAFLDSEDAWMEDKLAKQLWTLEVEKTDACLCGFVRLNRGNRRQTISYWPRDLRSCLHFECPFSPGSTLVMSRQTVDRIGWYDGNLLDKQGFYDLRDLQAL
jgi:glycosyltransferase involved in cell wall biosynthesis